MQSMKILILVKTYPLPSQHSGETVCTAGITEEGKWIRIYPIPLRMYENSNFKKYDWIKILVQKRSPSKDSRKESYRCDYRSIEVIDHLDTKNFWERRREICLNNEIFDNIGKLIMASRRDRKNYISLAIFKPAQILDLIMEHVDVEDRQRKRDEINKSLKEQQNLFAEYNIKDNWKMSCELDVKFRYKFADSEGKVSKLQIEDWEIGTVYLKELLKSGSKEVALQKVRHIFFDEFVAKKDIYFFMGTLFKNQMKNSRNPWAIIGIFYPPKQDYQQLLLPGL